MERVEGQSNLQTQHLTTSTLITYKSTPNFNSHIKFSSMVSQHPNPMHIVVKLSASASPIPVSLQPRII